MYLYERKRRDIFLALAPAVLCYVATLFPISLLGVIVGVGLTGVIGLIALLLAWVWLVWWQPVSRKRLLWLRVGLCIGLLGSAYGLVTFIAMLGGRANGEGAVFPLAIINVGILGLWFLWGSFPGRVEVSRESRVAAFIIAAALGVHAVLCAASLYGDLPDWVASQERAEAGRLGHQGMQAVETYARSHEGRLPVDNREAGLPSAERMSGRYIVSVTIDHGTVRLLYGKDPLSTLFGVDHGGSWNALIPTKDLAWICEDTARAQGNSCTRAPFGLPSSPTQRD